MSIPLNRWQKIKDSFKSLTQEERKKQLKEGVDGPVSNQPWLSSLNESHTTKHNFQLTWPAGRSLGGPRALEKLSGMSPEQDMMSRTASRDCCRAGGQLPPVGFLSTHGFQPRTLCNCSYDANTFLHRSIISHLISFHNKKTGVTSLLAQGILAPKTQQVKFLGEFLSLHSRAYWSREATDVVLEYCGMTKVTKHCSTWGKLEDIVQWVERGGPSWVPRLTYLSSTYFPGSPN